MPELEEKKEPQDRTFFFNVLNTLDNGIVDKMVYHAMKDRQARDKLEDEIIVLPKFRSLFT